MHVIWDWNGTLLADLAAVVDAVNHSISAFGAGPIDEGGYRRHYTRPVSTFYERLLERPVSAHEWSVLDQRFHQRYEQLVGGVALSDGVGEVLQQLTSQGRTQSLLSMAPHHHLVALVRRHELAHHFVLIEGLTGPSGRRKAGALRAHLDRLTSDMGVDEFVLVGDAIDDAAAAAAVGIPCVLYDGGSHERSKLVATGWPVVSDLRHAPIFG